MPLQESRGFSPAPGDEFQRGGMRGGRSKREGVCVCTECGSCCLQQKHITLKAIILQEKKERKEGRKEEQFTQGNGAALLPSPAVQRRLSK